VKFTHPELESKGIITKINIPLDKTKLELLKKCSYTFTQLSPGKFQVELHLKKGIEISLLEKPIELILDELLRKQEHGDATLELDDLNLNLNLLIHLLNTHFVASKK